MPTAFWTETLFRRLSPTPKSQTAILQRVAFLFAIWAIGAAINAVDNNLLPYLTAVGIYEGLYIPGIIILGGAYGVQNSLDKIIPRFKLLLDISEDEFNAYRIKIESVIYSIIPCIIIALIFAVTLSGVPTSIRQLTVEVPNIRLIWNITTALFFDLLSGTGVWMFLAIWYLIVSVSRKNYRPEILDRIGEGLGELMKLTLYYALFYFIAVTVAVALPSLSNTATWIEVIISPYLGFVALGALGVVLPLYSIHLTILKLKNERLKTVRDHSNRLIAKLEDAEANGAETKQILGIMAGLQAVQLKERHIQATSEWPVNMDFMGKLAGLIIMPTIVRVFIEIFRGYLPI